MILYFKIDSERIPSGLSTGIASEYNYIKNPHIKIHCDFAAGNLQ
jgi:hypothetical protein